MSDKYDSGHVIVPVVHPNGETHNIAVPPDTDLGDLHSALADAGYVHPAGAIPHQPTAEGAVENSPEFKRNAQRLWNAVRNGQERAEAGNFVTRGGVYTDLKKEQNLPSGGGRIVFDKAPESTLAQIHTHPRTGGPSDTDIRTAKDHKMTVYVVDSDGLHAVDPAGRVTRLYTAVGDLFDKKAKASTK